MMEYFELDSALFEEVYVMIQGIKDGPLQRIGVGLFSRGGI